MLVSLLIGMSSLVVWVLFNVEDYGAEDPDVGDDPHGHV